MKVVNLLFMAWLGFFLAEAVRQVLETPGAWWVWAALVLYVVLIALNVALAIRVDRAERRLTMAGAQALVSYGIVKTLEAQERAKELELVLLQHGIAVPDAH